MGLCVPLARLLRRSISFGSSTGAAVAACGTRLWLPAPGSAVCWDCPGRWTRSRGVTESRRFKEEDLKGFCCQQRRSRPWHVPSLGWVFSVPAVGAARGLSLLSSSAAGARAPELLRCPLQNEHCAVQRQFRARPGAFRWKLAFLPGFVCVCECSPRASLSHPRLAVPLQLEVADGRLFSQSRC